MGKKKIYATKVSELPHFMTPDGKKVVREVDYQALQEFLRRRGGYEELKTSAVPLKDATGKESVGAKIRYSYSREKDTSIRSASKSLINFGVSKRDADFRLLRAKLKELGITAKMGYHKGVGQPWNRYYRLYHGKKRLTPAQTKEALKKIATLKKNKLKS